MITQDDIDRAMGIRSSLMNKRRMVNEKIKHLKSLPFSQETQVKKNKLLGARRSIDQMVNKMNMVIDRHDSLTPTAVKDSLDQASEYTKISFWNKYMLLIQN